jgi:FtsZ-binding cell division protein ZapB
MSGNRVEELEAKVRQLQATVDGLTDELMETKERLHVLEEEVDPDLNMDIIEGRPTKTPETQTGNGNGESPSPEAPENQRAVDEAVEAADGAKGEESEENDEADSTDDIIVA